MSVVIYWDYARLILDSNKVIVRIMEPENHLPPNNLLCLRGILCRALSDTLGGFPYEKSREQ